METTKPEVCLDSGDVVSRTRDYSFGLTPNQLHRMGYYAPGEQKPGEVLNGSFVDGAVGADDWREALKDISRVYNNECEN
jgi:hypothetical protein